MQDWESELKELLEALNISPDEAPAPDGLDSLVSVERFMSAEQDEFEPFEHLGTHHLSTVRTHGLPSHDSDEVSAVQREMEATVARVVYLAKIGKLDRSLRDDVVFVLQALTRPEPHALPASERHEWHLGTAAAVLHFCRVVMRLTPPSPTSEPL